MVAIPDVDGLGTRVVDRHVDPAGENARQRHRVINCEIECAAFDTCGPFATSIGHDPAIEMRGAEFLAHGHRDSVGRHADRIGELQVPVIERHHTDRPAPHLRVDHLQVVHVVKGLPIVFLGQDLAPEEIAYFQWKKCHGLGDKELRTEQLNIRLQRIVLHQVVHLQHHLRIIALPQLE